MGISIDANSALSSTFSGMQASARVLDRATSNISKMGLTNPSRSESMSFSNQQNQQNVRESAGYTPSLTNNIIDVMNSSNLYTANAQVVQAADATIGSALNILI